MFKKFKMATVLLSLSVISLHATDQKTALAQTTHEKFAQNFVQGAIQGIDDIKEVATYGYTKIKTSIEGFKKSEPDRADQVLSPYKARIIGHATVLLITGFAIRRVARISIHSKV